MYLFGKKEIMLFIKQLFLLPLMVLISSQIYAQDKAMQDEWNSNTAFLLSPHQWEVGLLQPFRYSLNGKIEIIASAITIFILPNAGARISLGATGGYVFTSEHSISYPTLFLNIVSFKGTGGLISPQYSFPFILSVTNTFHVTKPVSPSVFLSASAGLAFAVKSSSPDYQATIDLPVFYPRMAHYYEGISLRASVSLKGSMAKKLWYEETFRLFYITRKSENLFAENSGNIVWGVGKSVHIKGGYILSWGRYPFGNYIQLWPVIDIVFGSWHKA